MVTHQLMSTRHLQLVKDKKTKDMSPPEGKIVRNLRIITIHAVCGQITELAYPLLIILFTL